MRKKIIIDPSCGQSIVKLINNITEQGVPDGLESIYDGKRNGIYDIEGVNVKAFQKPNIFNRLIYSTLRKSKANRSYEHAKILLELGVNTPLPYGYSEIHQGISLTSSYYFCKQLKASTMRDWDKILKDNELFDSFCDFVLKIHKKGIFHKDFSPGNVLYYKENGKYIFALIDINRMSFGKTDEKYLRRMFSTISIDPKTNSEITSRFARYAGIDEEKFVENVTRLLNRYLRKKRFTKRIKKTIRKCKGTSN